MKKIMLLAVLSAAALSSCGYVFRIDSAPIFPTIEIEYKGKNICSKPQMINESPVLGNDQYFTLRNLSVFDSATGYYQLIAKLTPPSKIAALPIYNLTGKYKFQAVSPTLFREKRFIYSFNIQLKCDDAHESLQLAVNDGSRIILEEDSTKYTGYSYTIVKDVVTHY